MAPNYDDRDREVTFEIVEEIGVISTSSTGWKKELNVVAWNGNQGKYDIREWSPKHDRMSKGMTFNEQEMRAIVDMFKRRARYVPQGRSTASAPRQTQAPAAYERNAAPPQSAPAPQSAPTPDDDEGWNSDPLPSGSVSDPEIDADMNIDPDTGEVAA